VVGTWWGRDPSDGFLRPQGITFPSESSPNPIQELQSSVPPCCGSFPKFCHPRTSRKLQPTRDALDWCFAVCPVLVIVGRWLLYEIGLPGGMRGFH